MTWQLEGLEEGDFFQRHSQEPWLAGLRGCKQDPVHHAEGDVFTHVGMVCAHLHRLQEYRELPLEDRRIVAWAALLHDIAKPECTVVEHNRVSSPGHAAKGAVRARRILWLLGCPFKMREEICSLVRYHMSVFWALEQEWPERKVREISLHARCGLLSVLAMADALGRVCSDTQDLLDRVELFRQLAQELDCLQKPAAFASDSGRFLYFQGRWHNPELEPYEEERSEVILLSGLPGAGKDTWIQRHAPNWPVISLDEIRRELKISPTAGQGKVLEVARERAREFLRRRESFIWNATNISCQVRQKPLALFHDYGARVRIVYLDVNPRTLEKQNLEREHAVPTKAIESMLEKWEVPSPLEAHRVEYLFQTDS